MANTQLAIVASPNKTTSYESLLQSQKELITKQINDLQNIVTVQCKLTGVNPLSQEMAAGALSIKIGKRPRDLLNPKAIKHMHSIFSVKDEISKKETRAISALFGLTATQVKDFFNSQRTKVRRFIRMSKEKAIQSAEGVQMQDGSLADVPNQPVPLNSMGPDPLNSTVPVPLNSTGPVPLNSTGPVPLNSTGPVPMNSTGPVPLNSTGPVPLNSTGPVPLNSTGPVPLNSTSPVPLISIGPSSTETPSSKQDEVLPDTDDSEKYFIDHIFDLLRKEETFNGQVKLMEWILQMKNAAVLYWFLTNGGVMILASWLSQAAIEEQTTVLHVILRVLCHLPLHKALPAHMSAILQSVNKLRFYRGSDISKRAKTLLSRWSKMFARSQAMRKSNAKISEVDAQNEMLLKQSIGEIMENESLERLDNPGAIYSLQENPENSSWSQSVKLLTGPSDDSNMKLLKGGTSAHRGRRKVQLVEQPGQKPASRGPQAARLVSTAQSRPLSADDIQKAKMRAQFMRSKYGESYVSPQAKTEALRASSTSQASKAHVQPKFEEHATSTPNMSPLAAKPLEQPKVEEHATSASSITPLAAEPLIQPNVEEHKTQVQPVSGDELQEVPVNGKQIMNSEEPVWKKCKRLHISWVTPPEININAEWSVCSGENSKEVDVQNNRIKREKEVFYNSVLEIPPNPKEPWDREMDYDDSLTPEIPSVQLPDDEDNMVAESTEVAPDSTSNYEAGTSTVAENSNKNMPEPDLELLAALLKNPEIVFALTAGQGGNLSNEQMVKLLDAVKANAASGGSVGSLVDGLVEKKQEQRVEVSLPSPTPSSNPVTSGWRQESATNPFSRQSVTVNGDPYAIPGVYYQETSTHQAVAPITHQRFSNMVLDQRNSPAAINSVAASSLTQQAFSPATYQTFSDMVPEHGLALQGMNAASNDYFSSGHSGSQLQPQWQVATEPRLSQVQSYTGRENLASSQYSYSEQNSSNYNPYGTREYAQPAASRTGASWAGNGRYSDQPGFESWSPENSPTRSHEYADAWDYSDPNVRNYNYRPEMSRMQQDHSRYRDRGGRNDGSRWRDRRR
ncbi:homeodomain-like, Transcription factor IIS [Artemisia annua]|uniref:Homeodomain-like, Transcription factor IIS n=1 Tax=Artemisia annua TaxID=35608 RepID=A0A2U1Q086_ARTAN|nr:homeodomain-like, Transcription factor IIS [Artemisia annua]